MATSERFNQSLCQRADVFVDDINYAIPYSVSVPIIDNHRTCLSIISPGVIFKRRLKPLYKYPCALKAIVYKPNQTIVTTLSRTHMLLLLEMQARPFYQKAVEPISAHHSSPPYTQTSSQFLWHGFMFAAILISSTLDRMLNTTRLTVLFPPAQPNNLSDWNISSLDKLYWPPHQVRSLCFWQKPLAPSLKCHSCTAELGKCLQV